jgi:gluconolactonase
MGRSEGQRSRLPGCMKVDAAGNVYCSGLGGIHVFSEDAECIGVIHLPSQVANFAFGGPDLRDLFVTARQSLYRLRVSVPGIAAL